MLSQIKKPFIFALLRQNNIPANAADQTQNLNPKEDERYQVPAGILGNTGIPNLPVPGFSTQDGSLLVAMAPDPSLINPVNNSERFAGLLKYHVTREDGKQGLRKVIPGHHSEEGPILILLKVTHKPSESLPLHASLA